MSDIGLPAWDDIAAEADRLQLASTPAELHGALAGWLAAGGADQPGWLAKVFADDGLPEVTAGSALDRLRATTVEAISDPGFGFELLLPDEVATPVRAAAMFAWCRAFLGGFGLAVGDKSLSEDGQEALGDLANLAAAHEEDVEQEGDEEALTEIEEYLRMAVLLLHADCALGPQQRKRLH